MEKIYAKHVICKAILLSDKIITVSQFSKSEILKYTKSKQEKIEVIHNGVDFANFKKVEDEKLIKETISKFDLPKSYFLFVGSIKPHKNLLNLLRALIEYLWLQK